MSNETFGNRLKRLRKSKKMTLEQLGKLSNSAKSYMWELEQSDDPKVSAKKLFYIADALGCDARYLLTGEEKKVKKKAKVDCKICKSKNISQLEDTDFRVAIEYSVCGDCGREFVSKDQIVENDRRIKKGVGDE